MSESGLKYYSETMRSAIDDYVRPAHWFLLIHDAEICLFNNKGRYVSIRLNEPAPAQYGIETKIDELLVKAKEAIHYAGQPLTVFLSGATCFSWIEYGSTHVADISKFVTNADQSKHVITLKLLNNKEGKKITFLSDIENEFGKRLSDFFRASNIPFLNIQPISYSILKLWSSGSLPKHTELKFPGFSIAFTEHHGIPTILELLSNEGWNSLRDADLPAYEDAKPVEFDLTPDKDKAASSRSGISALLKPTFFQFGLEQEFYKIGGGGRRTERRFLQLLLGMRLVGRTVLLLTLVALLAVSVSNTFGEKSDYHLKMLGSQYSRKLTMHNTRDSLSAVVSASEEKYDNPQYAALASAFCQKRPYGLILKTLTLGIDKNLTRLLTAEGTSQSEKAVFDYQETVSFYLTGRNPEIVQLKNLNSPSPISGQPPVKSFSFKMILELENDRN